MTPPALVRWHAALAARDPRALDVLLADDVVFHSPVMHTPQVGKRVTAMYLAAAFEVFGQPGFRYVREIVGAHDAALEFTVELDGVVVNGVDLIRWDASDRITDFKVMLRPLKAVHLIHERMAAMLAASTPRTGPPDA
ncbi:MAG: nuclear transport factor 2 family protein [Gemmatimonadetes bacterium]|nr:nuclear transport factor 2 family protein [Gemmatimonadota bacterium]MBP7551737.1 nuclear transport factor 2 family protein [Gemmatimonadaceae bacterium]